jgi:hypothetical protein
MVSAEDTDFIDEKMGYFELKGRFCGFGGWRGFFSVVSQAVGPKASILAECLSLSQTCKECPNYNVVKPIINHPH